MFETVFFVTILAPMLIYALAVPLPGPAFVVISREAVTNGWSNGSAAAFGTTLSAAVYALATVLGVNTLLVALPWLALAIQVAGGCYLLYLGATLVWHALSTEPNDSLQESQAREEKSVFASFREAFVVGLGNPKMIAFFAGLLAPALASDLTPLTKAIVFVGIILIDLSYHQCLALFMLKGRDMIAPFRKAIDAVAGGQWLSSVSI